MTFPPPYKFQEMTIYFAIVGMTGRRVAFYTISSYFYLLPNSNAVVNLIKLMHTDLERMYLFTLK